MFYSLKIKLFNRSGKSLGCHRRKVVGILGIGLVVARVTPFLLSYNYIVGLFI